MKFLSVRYAAESILDRGVVDATSPSVLVAERMELNADASRTFIPPMAWEMEYQMPYNLLPLEFLIQTTVLPHRPYPQEQLWLLTRLDAQGVVLT